MEGKVKIEGLDAAMKNLLAAFPNDPIKRRKMVNGAIGGAARKTILPIAKQLAKRGDSSGALSESLAVRAINKSQLKKMGRVGGMLVVPVRKNAKALAMYINYHYLSKGKGIPEGTLEGGIRHGHLVEFGHRIKGGGHAAANPFLWPAGKSGASSYRKLFGSELNKRIQSAVKRAAKKRAKK